MNPEYEDAIVEEPSEEDFYEDMGVTPEEAMSAAYGDMLAGYGLTPGDLQEMMSHDNVGEPVAQTGVGSSIAFDATRSLDGYGKSDEFELPFPEVEQTKETDGKRLQAKHNEPVVVRATRRIPNKPEFNDKADVGAEYDK